MRLRAIAAIPALVLSTLGACPRLDDAPAVVILPPAPAPEPAPAWRMEPPPPPGVTAPLDPAATLPSELVDDGSDDLPLEPEPEPEPLPESVYVPVPTPDRLASLAKET